MNDTEQIKKKYRALGKSMARYHREELSSLSTEKAVERLEMLLRSRPYGRETYKKAERKGETRLALCKLYEKKKTQ
jgi:hypothetical protein